MSGGRRGLWSALGLLWLAGCVSPQPPPPADCPAPWVLTDAQRRQLLDYYSPLLLKQADEALGRGGTDWITNFDFDRDATFPNNRRNWLFQLASYVQGGSNQQSWRIRPTLYSFAIEFTECGAKSVVLVYHVYHAMQIFSIHDWERVEIRLDGVAGGPGSGETIRFVVITRHGLHRARKPQQIQFYDNGQYGKHVLVWQAAWSLSFQAQDLAASPPAAGTLPVYTTAELRFVEDDWGTVDAVLQSNQPATVRILDVSAPTSFHYVFVDQADTSAVSHLLAAGVDGAPAGQASGKGWYEKVSGIEVKRVTYELQDTADVMVTHAVGAVGGWSWRDLSCQDDGCGVPCGSGRAWTCKTTVIDIEDPLLDETGTPVGVGAGQHIFAAESCDEINAMEERRGYPLKHWWWGTYFYDRDGKFTKAALRDGIPSGPNHGRRDQANGCSGCLGHH
ncbi:MAG: hypothetical protein O7G30_10945, partial [Proteobacteria bacterium]|nr:hypothetical protein [Pseudomonadota bacterium]